MTSLNDGGVEMSTSNQGKAAVPGDPLLAEFMPVEIPSPEDDPAVQREDPTGLNA
jgi:hypothetical protein